MRILLVGATGAHGRRAAAELARSDEADEIILAGPDADRLEALRSLLGGPTGAITTTVMDARERAAVARIASAADVVVSCAGPAYLTEAPLVQATIEAGAPYVSLCDDLDAVREVMALDASARAAGVTVVSGCGLSPGVTNLMASLAAEELHVVEEIEISVAHSFIDAIGEASVLHLLNSLRGAAPFASEQIPPASSGEGPRLTFFPHPVGWVETFGCGHPEIETLATTFDGLRGLRFRMGLTERAAMDALRASVALGLGSSEVRRRILIRLARPFRPVLAALPPHGPAWTGARVDVWGESEGRSRTVSIALVDHIQNVTSAALAYAALELGSGRVSAPGVHAVEGAFPPRAFLRGMAERGIRLARLEPESV